MKKLLVIVIAAAFLAGCGGSGSSNSGGSNDSGGISAVTTAVTVVFTDWTNYNATVCYDLNGNKVCDSNEPSASVNPDGTADITGGDSTKPLLVEFRAKTAAAQATKAATVFIMEAPAGKTLVSAFTTMVKNIMDSNPGYTLADAQNTVNFNIGKPAGTDLFSKTLYSDNSIKNLNNQCAELIRMFISEANSDGIALSPALISVISDIITNALAQIVYILANDGDISDILDNADITKDDVANAQEKLDNAANSVQTSIINMNLFGLGSWGYPLRQYYTWYLNFKGNGEFETNAVEDTLVSQYQELLKSPTQQTVRLGNATLKENGTARVIKDNNMFKVYINAAHGGSVSDFYANHGSSGANAIKFELENIKTDFPATAKYVTIAWSMTSTPSYEEFINSQKPSAVVKYWILSEGDVRYDDSSQLSIDNFDDALDSMDSWGTGGFFNFDYGAVILLRPDSGVAEFHDGLCVNDNNRQRNGRCRLYSVRYERKSDHLEIDSPTGRTYIYWSENNDGQYWSMRSQSFLKAGTICNQIRLNEDAIAYIATKM
jgi:phosphoglycolate phosphatase-like HAD superfamily hydrolase